MVNAAVGLVLLQQIQSPPPGMLIPPGPPWAGWFSIVLGIVVLLTGIYMLSAPMTLFKTTKLGFVMTLYSVVMLVLGVSMLRQLIFVMQGSEVSGIVMMIFAGAMLYSGYGMAKLTGLFCIECLTYEKISSGMVLVEGQPGSGKSSLVKAFVKLAAQDRRPIVYVSTQSSASDITEELSKIISIHLRQEGLHVLDCYSTRELAHNTKSFSPGNLTELGIEFQSTLRKLDRPCVVFDSIDSFAIDAGEDSALKFFRITTARVRDKKANGSATLTTGVHAPRFQTALRTFFQGIIELKLEESKGGLQRFLRILAIKGAEHTTQWYPFKITAEGILLGTEDYRKGLPLRHKDLHFMRFGR